MLDAGVGSEVLGPSDDQVQIRHTKGGVLTYDRHTMRPDPRPEALPVGASRSDGSGQWVLYRVHGNAPQVHVLDLTTGESHFLYDGWYNGISFSDNLALILEGRRGTLVDLRTGSTVELMDDNNLRVRATR